MNEQSIRKFYFSNSEIECEKKTWRHYTDQNVLYEYSEYLQHGHTDDYGISPECQYYNIYFHT